MPPSHIERPSPATTAPAACLPAPAAAGQGVGPTLWVIFGLALVSLVISVSSLIVNLTSRCHRAPVFEPEPAARYLASAEHRA